MDASQLRRNPAVGLLHFWTRVLVLRGDWRLGVVTLLPAMPGANHPTSKEIREDSITNNILITITKALCKLLRVMKALCMNLSRRGVIVVGRRGDRTSITREVRRPIVHERASFLDRRAAAVGSLGLVFDHVR